MLHRRLCLLISIVWLTACVNVPDGITPVSGFDQQRYLGTWYEIARLDHRFERGLSNVSATYAIREDGGISVMNRGFDTASQRWDSAEGKAFFVESPDVAFLKVSFFGPFYGSYVVFELDTDYRYAFVSGPNRNYLWLLARTPKPGPAVLERFKAAAVARGFDLEELIVVDHTPPSSD